MGPFMACCFYFCRAAVERHVLGMKETIPLTPEEFEKPLGPGYKAGKIQPIQT